MPVSAMDFRGALSRLAGGVCIVATAAGADRRGVTATAVCSVSAEPPTVLICVNLATGTCKMIEEIGYFSINLLGDHDRRLAETFAGRNGKSGNDRFQQGNWSNSPVTKMPILGDALGILECRVCKVVQMGTHAVFFGEVQRVLSEDHAPLVYHSGDFRSLSAEPQTEALPRRASASRV